MRYHDREVDNMTSQNHVLLEGLPLGVADCSVEFVLGFLTLLYNPATHTAASTLKCREL